MSTATIAKPAPKRAVAKATAEQQIDQIATTFSLTPDPNDIHGPGLREQLLSSYIEWLDAERRLASSELWPEFPQIEAERPGYALVPANTRWGGFHFSSRRWGGAPWNSRPHPLTRAALVLWAVGAIDDIADPFAETLAAYSEAMYRKLDDDSDEACDTYLANVVWPIRDRFLDGDLTPTTMAGAASAIRFVFDDVDGSCQMSPVQREALEGVLRFLEREGPQPRAVNPKRVENPTGADPLRSLVERLAAVEQEIDGSALEDGPLYDEQAILLDRLGDDPPAPAYPEGAAAAIRFVMSEVDKDSDHTRIKAVLEVVARFLDNHRPLQPAKSASNTAEPSSDPIFEAIDRQKAAAAAVDALRKAPDDDPKWKAADRAEGVVWKKLIKTTPTTIEGVAAFVSHLNTGWLPDRVQQEDAAEKVLRTLNRAFKSLNVGIQAKPSRTLEAAE